MHLVPGCPGLLRYLVAEHRLQACGRQWLRHVGSVAPWDICDLPRPGLGPMSPAMASGFNRWTTRGSPSLAGILDCGQKVRFEMDERSAEGSDGRGMLACLQVRKEKNLCTASWSWLSEAPHGQRHPWLLLELPLGLGCCWSVEAP